MQHGIAEASCADLCPGCQGGTSGCVAGFGSALGLVQFLSSQFAPKSLRDFGGIEVIDGLDFQSRWEVRQTNRP